MANETMGGASPFEAIRHEDNAGGEYWSARELGPMLTYSTWQKFSAVIEKAKTACENSGHAASDHFNLTVKSIVSGKGGKHQIPDYHLSRYACYLIVQNGDPSKPVIAEGQTYFAVQTRRAELADADELAGLTEAQKRLYIRGELVDYNKRLAGTAQGAGVLTAKDFAIFQDHGYRGLYNGETAKDIAARKGLPKGEAILNWMGSTELAANLFRATQTEEKIRRENITGKDAANATHHAVGREVRETIQRLGGTMPEDLPTPAESIREVERKETKRLEAERQPPLFSE